MYVSKPKRLNSPKRLECLMGRDIRVGVGDIGRFEDRMVKAGFQNCKTVLPISLGPVSRRNCVGYLKLGV